MTIVADQKVMGEKTSIGRPELLAPAGDWEAMRAAVANGADAVYFGLANFSARQRATNFTLEELPKVMEFLHGRNVRGYVAFNTLIFSDELEGAAEQILAMGRAGVDAVIVQDLGLVKLIKRLVPGLAVHGSTQMTLTEGRGVEFVKGLGVERVILARELSVGEIKKIAQMEGGLPVEVFVHGALCVAYSGQCLTSEALGGRSANRGQCAQACRLPYELMVDGVKRDLGDKAYLLSPQDLAAYDLVGDLAAAGVVSLKIEGRLKSAHYVAATTQTYRAAIEEAVKGKAFAIGEQERLDLEQSFSRGFTHGFLSGVNHQELVPVRFPKARGTRVGTVVKVLAEGLVVKLEAKGGGLKPGDGLVFDEGHPEQDEQGGRVFTVRPAGAGLAEIGLGRGDVNLAAIAVGAVVWKTDDPAMRKRLERTFSRDVVVRRVALTARVVAHMGEALEITLTAEGRSATVTGKEVLARAEKFPVTEAVVREQLGRLGETPYELTGVELETVGGPMVPKSVLNELRRAGVEKLLKGRAGVGVENPGALGEMREEILEHLKIPHGSVSTQTRGTLIENPIETASLHVLVRTMEQLEAMLKWKQSGAEEAGILSTIYCDFEDVRRYKEAVAKCRAAGVAVALVTLRVVKVTEEGFLRQIGECGPDAVVVRNLAAVRFYKEHFPELPQIGDFSLNAANELTAGILLEAGLTRVVPSYDLNWKQMGAMLARLGEAVAKCEMVIHQHMPMFHMEHCVFAHTLSNGKDFHDCGRPCEKHQVDLKDRVGEPHPLIPDVGCRNTLYNAQAQTAAEFLPEMMRMGARHFRVEVLRETGEGAVKVVERYARVLTGREEVIATVRSLRVLNQLGVTRGTLERE